MGHCDPQVVDFGGHFQFERVTYLGVLGPGCDSSESSLSLFRFWVADEKNDINFDCDIFVDWFIAYQ